MYEPSPEVKVRLFERIARDRRRATTRRLASAAVVLTVGSVLLQGGEGVPIPTPTPMTMELLGIGAGERMVPVEWNGPPMGPLEIGQV